MIERSTDRLTSPFRQMNEFVETMMEELSRDELEAFHKIAEEIEESNDR